MELLDIYDDKGCKTARTAERGTVLGPGEHTLAVHVWIGNGQGKYLIQKRALSREFAPGMWAVTGGMVTSGEPVIDAAVREAGEELGVWLEPVELTLLGRFPWMEWLTDVFFTLRDIPIKKLALQTEEVSDAMWASLKEIEGMIRRGEFIAYSYLDRISLQPL